VVGECDYLDPAFKQKLTRYVENGGRLLVIGPKAAALFASELGVVLSPEANEARCLSWSDTVLPVIGQSMTATLESKAQPFGRMQFGMQFITNNLDSATQPAASITAFGKGKMAATYFDFSRGYLSQRSPQMRAFLNDLTRKLFATPIVEVKGASSNLDVSVNRLHGKLAINLVNTSGAHWDTAKPLTDAIEPIGPLEISIRMTTKPAKITLQPQGQLLACEYGDGVARVTVPHLEIHSIIVVE